MTSYKIKTGWKPKHSIDYKNLYGRKINVYNIDNEKIEGTLTGIFLSKCKHKIFSLVINPSYYDGYHTFSGEVIQKAEIEYTNEITSLIISKCIKEGCIDISNTILYFANTYIEI